MLPIHRVDKHIELAEWLAFDCSNPELAQEWIQKAVHEEPDNPDALRVMGDVLQAERRYESALVYYDRTLELDADAVDALAEKAQTLCQLERWRDAVETADLGLAAAMRLRETVDAIAWQVAEEALYDAKAHALFELGDRPGSIDVLREGLRRYPDSEALLAPLQQVLTRAIRRSSEG
jgi:tetratricopeptide (TPR) repeat protein